MSILGLVISLGLTASGALALALAPSGNQDVDGGVDWEHNCMLVANPAEVDVDQDDFGNRCGADFDNDEIAWATDQSGLACAGGVPCE